MITLSENQLNNIDKLAETCSQVGSSISSFFKENFHKRKQIVNENVDNDELAFTFANLLERVGWVNTGISKLLPEYKKNLELDHSLGLIIRAGLLDHITIKYLTSSYSEEDSSNIEAKNRLCEFLRDQISFELKNRVELEKTGKFNDITNISFQQLKNRFPYLISEDTSEAFRKNTKTISVPRMLNKSKFHTIDELNNIKILYSYYSKYEHYGHLSYEYSRHPINEQIKYLNYSTELTLMGGIIALANLNVFLADDTVNFTPLKNELNKIGIALAENIKRNKIYQK